MQTLLSIFLSLFLAYLPASSLAATKSTPKKSAPLNEEAPEADLTAIFDQKLRGFDRYNYKASKNNNFSLMYRKKSGKMHDKRVSVDAFESQSSQLNEFKDMSYDPYEREGFWGFSLKIPLKNK